MMNSNSMKNNITENGGFKNKRASSGEIFNEEYSYPDGSRLSMDRNSFNNNSNPIWDHSGSATLDQTSSSGGLTDTLSPMSKSPWSSTHVSTGTGTEEQKKNSNYDYTGLMGSLIREEGHIYSLAASGELLYTGSDSKNIRVWKNQKEFSGFKSNSGLVKAIIISGDKIFTGHQDGKIRVWKVTSKTTTVHKRVGTLPSLKVYFKDSLRPCNSSRSRWTKHADAISCLSLSSDKNFLYSASWDRTIKVWRVSNSKCVESIDAHEDSVNAVVSGFDGLVFSGSADGTVKAWRIELEGKGTKHHFSQTLLKQECAVTALAVELSGNVLYCGTSDGNINFWERDNHLAHGGVLWGHKLAVLSLATAKDMVFSGSSDTNICVWKKEGTSHICLTVLTGHSGPVKCLAVQEHGGSKTTTQGKDNTDDKHWILYSGSLDKSVKIWKVSSAAKNQQPEPEFRTETFPSLHSFSSRGSRVCQMRPC